MTSAVVMVTAGVTVTTVSQGHLRSVLSSSMIKTTDAKANVDGGCHGDGGR